jgi:hypothetical protein
MLADGYDAVAVHADVSFRRLLSAPVIDEDILDENV